ncbi:MAG: MFS transporter [Chloroflexota bacterium]
MLAHFAHHLLSALLIPLLPFIRDDLNLDYTQAGWLVSAFTLTYGISHLPAGWLVDRLGARLMIMIGISGASLAGLFIGLSPNYWVMMIFLVLLGITGGGYHPAAAPLITASVEPRRGGWALGLHQIGGTGSHFLAPLIAVAIAAFLKWRGAFIALSFPTIAFGLMLYVILGKRAQRDSVVRQNVVKATVQDPTSHSSSKRLIAFLLLTTIGHTLINAVISFVPLFVVDNYKVSQEGAAFLLALVYSAGLWAGPLGGYLSDRLGRVPVILAASLLAGPIIYLLNVASYGWATTLVLSGIGMSLYMRMPVSEAYIIRNTPQRHRGTMLGIYYFGSRGGPGIFTPVLGNMIDHFGFTTSFTITATIMAGVALIATIFLWGRQD